MLMARRVVRTKTEQALVRIARSIAWSGSLTTASNEMSTEPSLGHVGGAVHPVGYGRPVLLGYRLDKIVQAFVLPDGDGETDLHLSAGGDDGMGIEAAVGPHRELPAGPAVAHPSHRLPQEVGGAASGVGPALAQPSHQHVASASGHGQQRVIAPLAGVAVLARPFLDQTVGLADGGVQVDGQGPVAGSSTGSLGPGQ